MPYHRTPTPPAVAAAVVLDIVMRAAGAQSVDVSSSAAQAGPTGLRIDLRVRTEGSLSPPLPPHCLRAELVADGRLLPAEEVGIRTRADPKPGWTRVELRHRYRPQAPDIALRLVLHCGPAYERHAQVTVHPENRRHSAPRAGGRPSVQHAASEGSSGARLPGSPPSPSRPPLSPTDRADCNRPAGQEDPKASPPCAVTAASGAGIAPPEGPAALLAPGPNAGTATTAPPPIPTAASAQAASRPGASAPTMDVFSRRANAALERDWQRLHAEHQRTLAGLSVLKARLAHQERAPSLLAWAGLAGLLGVALAALHDLARGRSLTMRWFRARPSRGISTAGTERPGPEVPGDAHPARDGRPSTVTMASIPGRSPGSTQATAKPTIAATRTAPNAAPSWRDGDMGQSCLTHPGLVELLADVDDLRAQGYPAAAALSLEHALTDQAGKHPALLLALLDLYEEMGQPWNRERVASQLERLYHVQAEPTPQDAPAESDEPTIAVRPALQQVWPDAQASQDLLASWLLGQASSPPLTLPAFREATWLLQIAQLREAKSRAPSASELTLAPLADP